MNRRNQLLPFLWKEKIRAVTRTIVISIFFGSVLIGQTRADIDSINAIADVDIFGSIEKSIQIYQETVQQARELGYPEGEAQALEHLATAFYLNGRYPESLAAHLSAVHIFESLQDRHGLITVYGQMGYQLKRRDLPRAIHYMRQAIHLAEREDEWTSLTALYDNYGVLMDMNGQVDSAEFYYTRSLRLKAEIGDTIGLPYSYNSLGGFYTERGDFSSARRFLQLGKKAAASSSDHFAALSNLVLWGDFFQRNHQPDSAILCYQQVISDSSAIEHKYQVSYCFDRLATLYEGQQNYRHALENQKLYQSFKDSLINIETNTRIAELQIQYETEKKDLELARERLSVQKRTTLLLIATFVILGLLLAGVAVVVFYRQEQKRTALKREAEMNLREERYRQKILNEKLRISRELHDNIGSHLTFILNSLENLAYQMQDQSGVKSKIRHIVTFGRETMHQLRNSIWALRIEEKTVEALVKRLNTFLSHYQSMNGQMKFRLRNTCPSGVELSFAKLLCLFRSAQEAVQNAIKYSGGTRIDISLECPAGNRIRMMVKDDGHGFDIADVPEGHGLGNMEIRCREVGGELILHSRDTGTEVICNLPL
ncbi:MAG: hypothetical protein D6762_09305 [Candidatus Neomarinimicrobiota bacterium]|nr:MAG: hypothetical protein D6762_09305 [Candidatus Neomarinimicrobiota bacterium]